METTAESHFLIYKISYIMSFVKRAKMIVLMTEALQYRSTEGVY